MALALKGNPMQIDKTQFKPFMGQEKQWWGTTKFCLYYEE
jgi:hypothetical protein